MSRNRQRACVYTLAYATWPRALVCAYLLVCVQVRHGAPHLTNKETLTVPLVSTIVPQPTCCHQLLSPALPPTCPGSFRRPWIPKLCCARIFLCLSPRTPWDNITAAKEDAALQQAVNSQIQSGLWPAANTSKRRATCWRPAPKSPFQRNVSELNVDKTTVTANGSHKRHKLRPRSGPR